MNSTVNSIPASKFKGVLTELREVNGKYEDHAGKFVHNFNFSRNEPFVLKELMITSGPYRGQRVYVTVDVPYFPFSELPLELRQTIYEMVFRDTIKTSIATTTLERVKQDLAPWTLTKIISRLKKQPALELRKELEMAVKMHHDSRTLHPEIKALPPGGYGPVTTKNCSILLVNREISKEAKEYLYRDRHFTFAGMKTMLDWLGIIGPGKKYITHLTCEKTGHLLIPACYRQLAETPRLQYFKITLPISVRATLVEHIQKHYGELKKYLLARNADEQEALRRLSGMHFAIGKEQMGVLRADGVPIREMTPKLEETCKELIRDALRKHFA